MLRSVTAHAPDADLHRGSYCLLALLPEDSVYAAPRPPPSACRSAGAIADTKIDQIFVWSVSSLVKQRLWTVHSQFRHRSGYPTSEKNRTSRGR